MDGLREKDLRKLPHNVTNPFADIYQQAMTLQAGDAEDGARLDNAILTEIIPRLMMAHRTELGRRRPAPARESAGAARVTAERLDAFLFDIVDADIKWAPDRAEDWLEAGLDAKELSMTLLAPAARRLNHFWYEDIMDFTEVTIGLSRLQQIYTRLAAEYLDRQRRWHGGDAEHDAQLPNMLLLAVPGDQHTFGVTILGGFFEDAGCHVAVDQAPTYEGVLRQVSAEHIDMVGFSMSCDGLLPSLKALIGDVRRVSMNKNVKIMVGGNSFIETPDLLDGLDIDGFAEDAPTAVDLARTIIDLRLPA